VCVCAVGDLCDGVCCGGVLLQSRLDLICRARAAKPSAQVFIRSNFHMRSTVQHVPKGKQQHSDTHKVWLPEHNPDQALVVNVTKSGILQLCSASSLAPSGSFALQVPLTTGEACFERAYLNKLR